jgi:hypothetical protein
MHRFTLLSSLCLLSLGVVAQEHSAQNAVGCWATKVTDFDNTLTVCINYDVAAISYWFTNRAVEGKFASEPTVCSQAAIVEYKEDNAIVVDGLGGTCRNGKKQATIKLRCEATGDKSMPCEMYVASESVRVDRVENVAK